MDETEHCHRKRTAGGVFPNVREPVDFSLLLLRPVEFMATKGVKEANAIINQRMINAFELAFHGLTSLKEPVTEVGRLDRIELPGATLENVF